MAKRKVTGSSPPPTPPSLSSEEGLSLLRRQKERAEALLQQHPLSSDDVSSWYNTTREVLIRTFGSDSKNIGAVLSAGSHRMYPPRTPEAVIEQDRRNNLRASVKMLDSCIDQLQILAPHIADEKEEKESDFWGVIHKDIIRVAKNRYDDGYHADAVESAFKEINKRVKEIVENKTGEELDGAPLMYKALSVDNPIIVLDNLSSETGRNIQKGYIQIFAGAMTGIRNPKAHENIDITPQRAMHFIFLASLLMYKLDEATY